MRLERAMPILQVRDVAASVAFYERLGARVKAWDDGAWVREGLLAHAEKKRARRMAAE